MESIILYGILAILLAGAQYLIPKEESKQNLIIRTFLLGVAFTITVLMFISVVNFLF